MNEPGNDLASRPLDNQDTVESLRRQVNLMFSGLIITSFTLTAYLGLQARRSSGDLLLIEPRADQMMKLSQQDAASMQPIVVKLQEFARTHPDFQKQVLSKYNFNLNPEQASAKK